MLQGISDQEGAKVKGIEDWLSPAIAFIVASVWLISLITIWAIPLAKVSLAGKILLLLWQTFLYTGLFVTAHDAMHGAACSRNRTVNDGIGTVALFFYGLFSYSELSIRHRQHHDAPASDDDPDYLGDGRSHFWAWYWSFMTRYWRWSRFFALVAIFHLVHHFLGIAEANLALGWVYPSVLSSLHLFYFGTYLPHRQSPLHTDHHRATTIPRPFILSLLACYHFGYHYEHHAYAQVPWWQLPRVYRQRTLG